VVYGQGDIVKRVLSIAAALAMLGLGVLAARSAQVPAAGHLSYSADDGLIHSNNSIRIQSIRIQNNAIRIQPDDDGVIHSSN
jgi:hypothetical protein